MIAGQIQLGCTVMCEDSVGFLLGQRLLLNGASLQENLRMRPTFGRISFALTSFQPKMLFYNQAEVIRNNSRKRKPLVVIVSSAPPRNRPLAVPQRKWRITLRRKAQSRLKCLRMEFNIVSQPTLRTRVVVGLPIPKIPHRLVSNLTIRIKPRPLLPRGWSTYLLDGI